MVKAKVRYNFEGWHHWPDAPGERRYLAHKHRHLFYVEACITVNHDDREIEFHDLLDFCKENTPTGDLGSMSCEMVARRIGEALASRYPGRYIEVSVFEDNEVGATVTLG